MAGFLDTIFSGSTVPINNHVEQPEEEPVPATIDDSILREYGDQDDGKYLVLSVRDVNTNNIVYLIDRIILSAASETWTFRHTTQMSFFAPQVYATDNVYPQLFQFTGHLILSHVDASELSKFRADLSAWLLPSTQVLNRSVPFICDITFKNCLRSGYITQLDLEMDANNQNQINIAFSLFVVNEVYL